MRSAFVSHDQDTIHAEKGCAEMCDFYMAALMSHTCHGIKARTHARAEIAHFSTRCIIRTWKALGLRPYASMAQMMHLVGKCVISAWAWVLAIFLYGLSDSWDKSQISEIPHGFAYEKIIWRGSVVCFNNFLRWFVAQGHFYWPGHNEANYFLY